MESKKQLIALCAVAIIIPCLINSRRQQPSPRAVNTSEFEADVIAAGNGHVIKYLENEQRKEKKAIRPSDYRVRPFNLSGKLKGLSDNQIDQKLGLYAGYVKKWNQIENALQTVSKENVASSYSPFRALKVGETYAMNGTILHELYFENLGTPGRTPEAATKKLLEEHFGSVQNYLDDLRACGLAARGWVLTCYSLYDGSVRNYVLDAHNERVPVMVVPLVVLDVYEHAYMIEFGTKRKQYLRVFANNINWPVIEQRVKKWVT